MTYDYTTTAKLFDAAHQPILAKHCHTVNLKKGQHAVVQGKQSPGLWYVEEGSCKVTVQYPGEKGIQALADLGPGSVFGEISFIDDSQCAATITATSDCECRVLSSITLPALEVLEPEVAMTCIHAVADLSAQRIRQVVAALKKDEHALTVALKQRFVDVAPEPIDDIRQLINDTCFHMMPEFKSYHRDDLHRLCQYIPCFKYAKGSQLYIEGEDEHYPFLVLRGAVQSYFCHQDRCSKLSVVGPGRFIGLVSMVDKMPRPSHAFAREPSLIMSFTPESLAILKKQNIDLFHKVTIDMKKSVTRSFRPFLMHLLQAQSMKLLA